MIKFSLIIVAAGMGTRLGLGKPKALCEVVGKQTLLDLVLERFSKLITASQQEFSCERILVTYPEGWFSEFNEIISRTKEVHPLGEVALIVGGGTRQDSVKKALDALALLSPPPEGLVAIHDAARCLLPLHSFRAVIQVAAEQGAATLGIPVVDSLRRVLESDKTISDLMSRDGVWQIQTPQVFEFQHIFRAHADISGLLAEIAPVTDDAELVRRICPVRVVEGAQLNFKVTTPDDFDLLRILWSSGNLSL